MESKKEIPQIVVNTSKNICEKYNEDLSEYDDSYHDFIEDIELKLVLDKDVIERINKKGE